MGWSGALYFCHAAVSDASARALERLGMPPAVISDRAPPPRLTRKAAAPYVDNGNIIGVSK
eukprot:7388698-Lingulodinium_polyedra.AAC.1